MFKHNLTATLNIQRPDKRGLYPLRIRATIKRKVTYYPTGIMLAQNQWHKESGKIILHPSKTLLNATLDIKLSEIQNKFIEQSLAGNDSPIIEKKTIKDFIKYVEGKIQKNKPLRKESTTIQLTSALNKFKGFRAKLSFTEINANLLHDYEDYCRFLKNADNTVWSSQKFIKTFVRSALNDGIIKSNPILNFKGTRYKDPMREILTQEEITLLEIFADNKLNSPKLINVATWWILGAYTGLRYSDMVTFDGLVDGRVLLSTQKTGAVVSIVATDQIKRAINRITQPIFSNQKCNEYIHAVMAILGINKKISFHNSRHSFGVLFIKNGGDIFKLSKIMGHKSIKNTMIYAQIASPTLDAEMQRVFKL